MAFVWVLIALAVSAGCRGGLVKQYEYEEEIYLSIDGRATMHVNASLPSLVALRGLDVDPDPRARLDRTQIRALYNTPLSRVSGVSSWRRAGRRFVQIRIEIDDIRRLGRAAPFAWSSYAMDTRDDVLVFRQRVGASAGKTVGAAGWRGDELVAFRIHVPSRIVFHNTTPENYKRGNILVWEQAMADRAAGRPLEIEARMETTSILYRTLWLFAGSFVAAIAAVGAGVWWILKRGGREAGGERVPPLA